MVVAGLLGFVPTLLIGLMVLHTYPKVSPIDELQHIDAAIKAAEGRWILPVGELIGQEAMRIEACSGIDADFTPPPCQTAVFDPATFQELGINTAAGRPSLFYPVTGYLGRLLDAVLGVGFLEGARLASLLIHSLGVGLLGALAARLTRSVTMGGAVAVIVGLIPPVLSQAVTVNPDAWSYPATVLVVAAALLVRDRRPIVAIPALTLTLLACALIKANYAVLLAVPPLVALLAPPEAAIGQRLRRTVPAVLSAGIVGVVLMLLQAWSSASIANSDRIPPMAQYLAQSATNPWDWGTVVNQIVYSLVPTLAPGVVDVLGAPWFSTMSLVIGAALFGATVIAVAAGRNPSNHLAMGWAALVVLIAGPTLTFALQWVGDVFFPYPQRYSYPAIPLAALALVLVPGLRRWAIGVAGVAMVLSWWFLLQL